jgi:hypothetical protein|tara:strand:- start:37 stop:441 length:405 start_codon:yes stop_codon:yes gene_type:complete
MRAIKIFLGIIIAFIAGILGFIALGSVLSSFSIPKPAEIYRYAPEKSLIGYFLLFLSKHGILQPSQPPRLCCSSGGGLSFMVPVSREALHGHVNREGLVRHRVPRSTPRKRIMEPVSFLPPIPEDPGSIDAVFN